MRKKNTEIVIRPRQAKKHYSKSCRNDNNTALKLLGFFFLQDNNGFKQIKETGEK